MKKHKIGAKIPINGGVVKVSSVNPDGTATAHWHKPPKGIAKGALYGNLPSLEAKKLPDLPVSRGSDVSGFEKIFRKAIVSGELEDVDTLYFIPEEKKPTIFRGKDIGFINTVVKNFRDKVSEIANVENPVLTTTNDNKDGNDFYEQKSGTEYELKLGGATDANLGIGIMEWSLESHGIIRNIMGTMEERKKMFLKGVNEDEIIQNKEKSKQMMSDAFNKKLTVGSKAPAKLVHTAMMISKGITKEEVIVKAYKDGKIPQQPHLLLLQKDGSFKHHDNSFPDDETFIVEHAGVGKNGGGAQIILRGTKSKRTIEFRQHFKNSHTDSKSGIKIPAKFWVKTPCFNVWIG